MGCKTCSMVGHDCHNWPKVEKPKVYKPKAQQGRKEWVPKKKVPVVSEVPKLSLPVVTPQAHPAPTSDDDAGWKLVTKKSKDKGKSVLAQPIGNSFALLAQEAEVDEESSLVPGQSGSPND